jgi:protein transport protein SEC31
VEGSAEPFQRELEGRARYAPRVFQRGCRRSWCEAIAALKLRIPSLDVGAELDSSGRLHEPVVSFLVPERESSESSDTQPEPSPSEVSASATSDLTSLTKAADVESSATEPSLFGDDNLMGTPQTEAAADFFSSLGTITSMLPSRVLIPHVNPPMGDSSVAATQGSWPSSVISESLKSNTFKIYPTGESEVDRLVTHALVVGDFESAVSLCLSLDRFADAILLAVRGGAELLQRTQKAYFERRTTTLPYLRLFQSIVSNDLADVVQNAELGEWQEIFVALCTFAKADEFANLVEQLGQRLECQSNLIKRRCAVGRTRWTRTCMR